MLYYEDERIKLYNNDVLIKNLFEKDTFDLIVTSPPYNVEMNYSFYDDTISYNEYLQFTEQWLENCFYWAKNQCRLCLNIPLENNKNKHKSLGADITILAQKIGWKYRNTIIWYKRNVSKRTAWGSWLSASAPAVNAPVELIVVFYKKDWKKTNGSKISDITRDEFINWTNGLWDFPGETKKIGHPSPFPYELPYRCIKLFSYVDDIVFDPFCGSGTTLKVVKDLRNRYGVGVEIDKNYCDLIIKRLE